MTNGTARCASARAPRGSSGLPAGIIKARKKYQARLSHVPTGFTKKQMRPIGTFNTVDEAVTALAEAEAKYAEGGEAAVWQQEKQQRAARGSVRLMAMCMRPARRACMSALALCSGSTTREEAEGGVQACGEDAWRWPRP